MFVWSTLDNRSRQAGTAMLQQTDNLAKIFKASAHSTTLEIVWFVK